MSISTKFGHSMSKGSRDTREGPRRPPPVSGKDFLMPCGIGLTFYRVGSVVQWYMYDFFVFKDHQNLSWPKNCHCCLNRTSGLVYLIKNVRF